MDHRQDSRPYRSWGKYLYQGSKNRKLRNCWKIKTSSTSTISAIFQKIHVRVHRSPSRESLVSLGPDVDATVNVDFGALTYIMFFQG